MIHQQAVESKIMLNKTASTAVATADLDTQGADYASITVLSNQLPDTNRTGPSIQLYEYDSGGTNSATFASGTSKTLSPTGAKGAQCRYEVDARSRKRYLRVKITPGTAATNEQVALTVLGQRSRLDASPAGTADMVDTGVAVIV